MTFDYLPLRFRFVARDALRFPPHRAGNLLRGALGAALHRAAPDAYQLLFAPAGTGGPSGLADRPRPFVLRVRDLEEATLQPGQPFSIGVHLFDSREPWVDWLRLAWEAAAAEGLGAGRGRAALETVDTPSRPVCIPLTPDVDRTPAITVEFLTPTELKPVNRPEFPVLFSRARDRVATLRSLYGPGAPEVDFRGLGQRAAQVQMTHCRVRQIEIERHSRRSGRSHPIGGFLGSAGYAGEMAEFLPWLRAAAVTGVGRHTVWGNGEMAFSDAPA